MERMLSTKAQRHEEGWYVWRRVRKPVVGKGMSKGRSGGKCVPGDQKRYCLRP